MQGVMIVTACAYQVLGSIPQRANPYIGMEIGNAYLAAVSHGVFERRRDGGGLQSIAPSHVKKNEKERMAARDATPCGWSYRERVECQQRSGGRPLLSQTQRKQLATAVGRRLEQRHHCGQSFFSSVTSSAEQLVAILSHFNDLRNLTWF